MPRLEWVAFMASQAEGAAEVEGGASEVAKPKRKTERVSKARLRVCVCVCARFVITSMCHLTRPNLNLPPKL